MPSPGSCLKCSARPAVTPSGLCAECAETANQTPRALPPPSVPGTASFQPFVDPLAPTATGVPKPSAARRLPHVPGYDLVGHLGHGGMGDVYLAREQTSERDVAMKFVRHPGNPEAFERFLNEWRVLAQSNHAHIVRVFASDFLRADPYFTMEYLPRGSLTQVFGKAPVPWDDAVTLIRKVAGAVAAAHAAKIIHRDLKPSNILLDNNGEPKVADFGLAKCLDEEDPITVASGGLGTPGYMPPEQISSKNGTIGSWSDVYGLGATLYHLFTGRAPFVGETTPEIIEQVLADPPVRPRKLCAEIPMGVEAVVLKCLEKDPNDRYQTVAEFVADLEKGKQGTQDAPPLTRLRRAKLWVRRNRRGLVVAVALAVILVAGVFVSRPWRELNGTVVAFPQPIPVPAPRDPLAEMREALSQNKQVVFVGKTGQPIYSRSYLEPTRVGDSPFVDGTCAFHAFSTCLLELWPDPGCDRYRIALDVRHLRPQAPPVGLVENDYVGVYFGHSSGGVAPRVGHAALAVTFEDYPAKPAAPDAPKRPLWMRRLGFTQGGDQWVKEDSGKPAAILFDPSPKRPGPWRRIVIDVARDEVVVQWCPDPDNKPDVLETLARWSGTRTQDEYTKLKNKLNDRVPGMAAAIPNWSPRMPFGIVAHRSSVSFRNVVLTPRP